MPQKTFFITGANSGFGFAIAAAASRKGHKVIGTVRSKQSRAALAERLPDRQFAHWGFPNGWVWDI